MLKEAINSIKRQLVKGKYSPLDSKVKNEYNAVRAGGVKPLLCYAPFKALRFSVSGNALACCFNRKHTLGKYPENSISDIWFGERASKLRSHLEHDDLSLGCQVCNRVIQNGDFNRCETRFFDDLPETKSGYPVKMEFELDNTCNLECIMCSGEFSSSIRKNRENKEPYLSPYDKAFVEQLEEFMPYLHTAHFIGGEPFLINIYYDIWERMVEINPKTNISLTTNGTILNNKVKTLLEKGMFHLNVSLDSIYEETYKKLRVNGKLNEIQEHIKYFKDYSIRKGTFLGFSFCVVRQNWRELPNYLTYCNDMDVSIKFQTVHFPAHTSVWNLKSSELKEIKEHLNKFEFPLVTDQQRENSDRYKDLVKQITQWYKNAVENEAIESVSSNQSTEELKSVFYKRLNGHIENDPLIKKEKNANEAFQKIQSACEASFKGIDDPDVLKNSLLNLNKLPPGMIIDEIEAYSVDHLTERFKQAFS